MPTTTKKSAAKATPKPTSKRRALTTACDADRDVSDCDARTQAKYRAEQEFANCPSDRWDPYEQQCVSEAQLDRGTKLEATFAKCPNSWNEARQRCISKAERQAAELDAAGEPGEAALVLCQEQTGLSRKQCRQQAEDGLAN